MYLKQGEVRDIKSLYRTFNCFWIVIDLYVNSVNKMLSIMQCAYGQYIEIVYDANVGPANKLNEI